MAAGRLSQSIAGLLLNVAAKCLQRNSANWPKHISQKGQCRAMKPRELSIEDCTALLSTSRYGRLALSLNDSPYVIPMSYVFSAGKIFLHSRGGGKKDEIASQNPRVCFEVDRMEKNQWSSVVVYGKASLSTDLKAKMKMFESFMGKDMKGHGGKQFSPEDLERMPMTVWEIEVLEMTGREGVW